MSNKASNQLHELIHSLTPAEKRYFKLFAERHSSSSKNNYLKLFEAIDRQEVYQEEALLGKFRKEAFVKHFSIAKNRLYHQILKSLDAFHAESSADAEIRTYIHYAEILFHKNLHRQCQRLLNTAEKLADKYENHSAMLRILEWQKKLVETQNHETDEAWISAKQADVIQKLTLEKELWETKTEVFTSLFRSGRIRDVRDANMLKQQIDKLQKREEHAADLESKYLIHHIKGAIYFGLSDFENCRKELMQNLELTRNHRHLIADDPLPYHSLLINLIYACAKLNRMDEVREFIEESKSLPEKFNLKPSPYVEYRLFCDTYGLELAICNLTANTKRGEFLLEKIPPLLDKWENRLSKVKRASFMHGLSVVCYTLDKTNEALHWNNELLNSTRIDQAEDQVLFAQMMHAVIHYDLGHFDLLNSILKSLKRYLEIRGKRYAFESHFIELIGSLIRDSKEGAHADHFRRFRSDVLPLEKERFEKVAFEYFDFIAWASSKIENREFSECVRERSLLKDVL